MDVTLETVREAKIELENKIHDAIVDFEKKTDEFLKIRKVIVVHGVLIGVKVDIGLDI